MGYRLWFRVCIVLIVSVPLSAPLAQTPAVVVQGLPSLEALAFNPQNVPFLALSDPSGRVLRVLGRSQTRWLAESGGGPSGIAFDAQGDLYLADRRQGILFKITPWGEIAACAEWLGSPEGVAVGPDQEVYFTDSARSGVFQVTPTGEPRVVAANLSRPKGIAVSMETGDIYVSTKDAQIWRLAPDGGTRKLLASLTDQGEPAGLALDEKGNLYVARDGGGQISVLDRQGKLVGRYPVPGPDVKGVAFGGLDLKTLYVAEARTGGLYTIPVEHRSQRMPWDSNSAIRFIRPVDGDILNRHDGETTSEGLRVDVRGYCRAAGELRVNGQPVKVRGGEFQTRLLLRERENAVVAEVPGAGRETMKVYWDKDSWPRYRLSTDDNIVFLKDIAERAGTYKSIFENPYLAFWQEMNKKYGSKVDHNIYFQTSGFNLSQMPDRFRSEWRRNADWMRLSFHARGNDPGRPYIHASAEEIRAEFRRMKREVERFAGPETWSRFTTVHWGEATRAAARALREEGIRGLVGYFRTAGDFPSVSYYLPFTQMMHLRGRDYWKDTREDLLYVRHDIIINTVRLEDIVPYLEKVVADPHQSEVMELMIHEQYFYPEFRGYQPDFRDRVERAIQFVSRRGYKPVFFLETILPDVRTVAAGGATP